MADNPTLRAAVQNDPAFQQAWTDYQTTVGALQRQMPTIAQERADDSGVADDIRSQINLTGYQFGDKVRAIIKAHGGDPQNHDFVVNPQGQFVYDPDHSLRNNLLILGGIVASGVVPAVISGGAGGAGAGGAGAAASGGTAAAEGGTLASTTIAPVTGSLAVPAASTGGITASGIGAAASGGTLASLSEPATASTLASTTTAPTTGALATPAAATGSTGVGTAATTGGGMTTGSVLQSPVVSQGVGGIFQYFGAKKAANAAKDAAATEAQSARESLDFQKQVYRDLTQQRQPYVNFGSGALGTLSGLLGIPVQKPSGAFGQYGGTTGNPVTFGPLAGQGQTPNYGPNDGPNAAGATPQAGSAATTAGFTLMRAPDGSVRQVPSHLVMMAKAAGGQLVS